MQPLGPKAIELVKWFGFEAIRTSGGGFWERDRDWWLMVHWGLGLWIHNLGL
jgi:hypothetical protein